MALRQGAPDAEPAAGGPPRLRRAPSIGLLVASAIVVSALGSAAPDGPSTAAPAAPRSTAAPHSTATTAPARLDVEPVLPGAQARTALAAVAQLEVKGRAPGTGYDRELFAYRAVDLDRNGCDTRNDILGRDLVDITYRAGTGSCVVQTGTLTDPYGATAIAFQRGSQTSGDIQIDHVVALSDAWQKGAQGWDEATRQRFGNDPLNLLAVSGPLNAQKGDGDTATWLPPDKDYRCAYVARQVGVKVTYGLWVTSTERDAMVGVLATCPDQPLPVGSSTPPSGSVPTPAPAPEPPAPGIAPATEGVPYPSCAAARAAGAAPVLVGRPGYGSHLDGDGDGIGCE